MARFTLEVYKGQSLKRGFLANTIDEATRFLSSFLQEPQITRTITYLCSQESNPKAFPNVVLFLDNDNQMIMLDEFLKIWKEKSFNV